MVNNNNGDEFAETKPGKVMEQLKKVTPATTTGGNVLGRTLSSNEAVDAKAEFEVASLSENKNALVQSVKSNKSNEIAETEKKKSNTIEPKAEQKIEQKSEVKAENKGTWGERFENSNKKDEILAKKNEYNATVSNEKNLEKNNRTWAERFEGEKKSYNENNNIARGKSLYEVKPATATSQSIPPSSIPSEPKSSYVERTKDIKPSSPPPKGPRK